MRRERPVAPAVVPALLALAGAVLLSGCVSTGPGLTGDRASASAERRTQVQRSNTRPMQEDAATRRGNSDVLVELGQRYYARGEYQIALEKLQSALNIDPRSANAHTVIAILYETIGDDGKAADHYRRSAQLAPRNGDVLNNFGSWLCRQGRFDDADAHFRRALADPFYRTPESALANAGTCALAAGRHQAGGDYLRQVLARRPDDTQALVGLAEVAYREGDLMRARAFLQRAEAQVELGRTALELAVRVEEGLGDSRAAAAYRSRLGGSGE
ncbi:MAG: type IV pilus biogenesis/stability protein PilW [Xanthomonadales bacterium]|nr:type IV pilus biogenesis/stability protein PilW [Xanthomonadales bacterium]